MGEGMGNKKDPVRQGGLDGLCGLYAVINACNNLKMNLGHAERMKLFELGICYLDEKNILKNTMVSGMGITHVKAIIRVFKDYLVEEHGVKLISKPITANAGNINGLWTLLSQFMEDHDGAVVLGLTGMHDHWTCVVDISDATLQLCDSDGLRRINKSYCTCGKLHGDLKHVLDVDEVLALRLE